jgi:hypothetical protein
MVAAGFPIHVSTDPQPPDLRLRSLAPWRILSQDGSTKKQISPGKGLGNAEL